MDFKFSRWTNVVTRGPYVHMSGRGESTWFLAYLPGIPFPFLVWSMSPSVNLITSPRNGCSQLPAWQSPPCGNIPEASAVNWSTPEVSSLPWRADFAAHRLTRGLQSSWGKSCCRSIARKQVVWGDLSPYPDIRNKSFQNIGSWETLL